MYKPIFFAALLVCVASVPLPGSDRETVITKFVSDLQTNGNFGYTYEQSDGTAVTQQGTGASVQGSYSYTSPEGVPVFFTYVADDTGYHPNSDLLPTPPAVPEAIARAIEYIQSHPTPEEQADREVRKTQF